MSIYTVFLLADPNEPTVIRFVGYTTQTVEKRLTDLVAAAQLEGHRSFDTPLNKWVRSVLERGQRPKFVFLYETKHQPRAAVLFHRLVSQHSPSGLLLNTNVGPKNSKSLSGRPVDMSSCNAKHMLRKKINEGHLDEQKP